MKTPLTYYGGKQKMTDIICKLIPEHYTYCEPFLGGGAVFFAKPKSKVEVINDINSNIINFYDVLKNRFEELNSKIQSTLYSRRVHHHAQIIYNNPDLFDNVTRAWAVWALSRMSFNSSLDRSFRVDRLGRSPWTFFNNQQIFVSDLSARLLGVCLENDNVLSIIDRYDSDDTFFYLDPPYVGANQGHYSGYTQADFDELLTKLSEIKGKFLLSSYNNVSLDNFVKHKNWNQLKFKMSSTTSNLAKKSLKIEVLTSNYPISIDSELLTQTV